MLCGKKAHEIALIRTTYTSVVHNHCKVNRLIGDLTALSAQWGYIVPSKSMLQLKPEWDVWNTADKATAEQCRQLGHLSNFSKATETPFSLRHVKHSCHQAPLHFLLWHYTSSIIALNCIVYIKTTFQSAVSVGKPFDMIDTIRLVSQSRPARQWGVGSKAGYNASNRSTKIHRIINHTTVSLNAMTNDLCQHANGQWIQHFNRPIS